MSLEQLLGQRSTHSHSALDRAGTEVGLSLLSSGSSLVNVELGHYIKNANEQLFSTEFADDAEKSWRQL